MSKSTICLDVEYRGSTDSISDYCIVAFFIVIVISVIQWFVDGSKNFKGPQIELVGEEGGHGYANGDAFDDKSSGDYQDNGHPHGNIGEMHGTTKPVGELA